MIQPENIDVEVPQTPRSSQRPRSPPAPPVHWRSCCIDTDRAAVVYIGQMAFAAGLVALCAVMLVNANGSCDKSTPYVSLLSFLAGKVLAHVIGG